MRDPRTFDDHYDERSYGPEVCPTCGEEAYGLFKLHENDLPEQWNASIQCEPCWRSVFEYGRRHVGEAWEDDAGNPLPDPMLVRVRR